MKTAEDDTTALKNTSDTLLDPMNKSSGSFTVDDIDQQIAALEIKYDTMASPWLYDTAGHLLDVDIEQDFCKMNRTSAPKKIEMPD